MTGKFTVVKGPELGEIVPAIEKPTIITPLGVVALVQGPVLQISKPELIAFTKPSIRRISSSQS